MLLSHLVQGTPTLAHARGETYCGPPVSDTFAVGTLVASTR
jgi:hypothetical protein